MRKIAMQCGATEPSTLTPTNLRKHTLAQFLGYDIGVHRKFHRLPNEALQSSQLAKIFMLIETGELSKHKGKSLDELLIAVTDYTNIVSEYVHVYCLSLKSNISFM